jgi:hypothetical protein
MKETVRLDEDVAALARQIAQERSVSVETVVNESLREGLSQVQHSPLEGKRLEPKVFDLGPCLLPDLDDISRVLAIAEGEAFR